MGTDVQIPQNKITNHINKIISFFYRSNFLSHLSLNEHRPLQHTDTCLFHSDKSDLESHKGANGRHKYSGPESGGGRAGGGNVGSHHSSSIPPDALYTTRPRHTTPSVSSKPDHEYENLKVRLG